MYFVTRFRGGTARQREHDQGGGHAEVDEALPLSPPLKVISARQTTV
jgi:hypothetical protein